MLRSVERIVLLGLVAALLALNAITLTSASIHGLLFDWISKLPIAELISNSPTAKRKKLEQENSRLKTRNSKISTELQNQQTVNKSLAAKNQSLLNENKNLASKNTRLKNANLQHHKNALKARSYGTSIIQRSIKNAVVNVSAVAGEAVPFYGAGLVVAVTLADLKDGCDNAKEINEMLRILGQQADSEGERKLCGMSLPGQDEKAVDLNEPSLGGFLYDQKQRLGDKLARGYENLGGFLDYLKNER